ncbi:facilitated trehalose transporter Tret1-like [Planococcus citri]|uniref:facilitated trehalose transporter Tret1-like n=1 Tax=Planococcus citri TaxID=170843 RepID=UPI0031F9CFD7
MTNGIANGWVAPTLKHFEKGGDFGVVTKSQISWIASLEDFGKIFGAVFAALVLDILGRRPLLASVALIFFLIWLATAFTNSIQVLCMIRFIAGVFAGINEGSNSIYLAENSSPRIRPVCGSFIITVYFFGLIGEFFVATYLPYKTTLIINAVVSFLAFLSVFCMKESVQYTLMKGRESKAAKDFAWLRGISASNPEIELEFEKIKQNVSSENSLKSSLMKTISTPVNYRSLAIVVILYSLAGSVGYFPMMWYASMTFTSTNMLTSNEFTILFGIVQTIVVIPTSFVIGRINRRSLILTCFSLITLSHLATASLYYANQHITNIPHFPWLTFSTITFFASVYAFMYPGIFLIRGELFPLSVKALGGCLSIMSYSATSFFTTKIFLFMSDKFGVEVNFVIFALLSSITIVFVYFFLPETKNKSLIQIQESLTKVR